MHSNESTLPIAQRVHINTRQEPILFLREDSVVARSEGFNAMSRVKVAVEDRAIIATLVIVGPELLPEGHAGLSEIAWHLLALTEGQRIRLSHPAPVASLSFMRHKVYGHELNREQITAVISDIVAGRYMDVQIAAFITACADNRLSRQEMVNLTRAMVESGERLAWSGPRIVDKHCVGGLPGNRTTPVVVAIAAAAGLIMPKTSSRAITSPAGTADVMETLAPVELEIADLRRVVAREGGCVAWGGAANLSPADDILIRVEKALGIDSEGQLVASILSKKIAAGSTDVLIDIPVGPTAKIRSEQAAALLAQELAGVGAALGIKVQVEITDGRQPVGRGIGPALEARDVLAVLRNQPDAPEDLRERCLRLAGRLLELANASEPGKGYGDAREILDSGAARDKFYAICKAQGGMREPPVAPCRFHVLADRDGTVSSIDNRLVANVAKLAGAPVEKSAGLEFLVRLGQSVKRGEPLMIIHAASPGELEYAVSFQREHPEMIRFGDASGSLPDPEMTDPDQELAPTEPYTR